MQATQTALIPLLRENGKGFAEMAKRAESLGLILSNTDVAALDTLGKSMSRIKSISEGFLNRVIVKFSPLLVGILNDFEQMITEAGGFQAIIDKSFSFAIRAAGVLANGIHGIRIAFNVLKGVGAAVIGALSGSIGKLVGWIGKISGKEGLQSAGKAMQDFQSVAFDTFDESTAKAKELSLAILPSEVIKKKTKEYQAFGDAVIAKNAQMSLSEQGQQGSGVSEIARQKQQEIKEKFALLQGEAQGELALNQAKLQAKLQQDIEFLSMGETARLVGEERSNALIEQMRTDHIAKMSALEQDSINGILAQQIDYGQRRETLAADLAERQRTIDALSAQGKVELATGAFRQALSVAATGSKKLFELNKKFALADAVINGFKAIQSGFATSPFFPVGIAMGALAAVQTAAQIRGIQSQKFGGGGSKPTAVSRSASVPSASSGSSGGNSPTVQGPQQGPRKASIVVQGEIDTREKTLKFAQDLVALRDDGFTEFDVILGAPA